MPCAPDRAATFLALYQRHRDDVWRYLRRRTDHHVAEDLTTEVFIVAWRRRPDAPADALPWLYGVARNVLANHRRGAGRAAAVVERASHDAPAVADDHAALAGVRADLAAALRQLSLPDREVLLLAAWEGLGSREIAQVLGCRGPAARARLHRARKRLRAALEPEDPPVHLTTLESAP